MGKSRKERASGPRVAYTCSYVPEEIILAAGLMPERLIPGARPSEADGYMHPNTCPYVKSLLAAGLAGIGSGIDAIVFANSCDGMRRLNDVWKKYVESVPALFVDVPKKKDPASVGFFASELRRFAGNLEKAFQGSRVTDVGLEKAIRSCNEVRMLMERVFMLQRDGNASARGSSVLELCLAGARSGPSEFAERVRKFLSDAGEEKARSGEPRVLLAANVLPGPELSRLVEDLGGCVVALDSCIGLRHYDTAVMADTQDAMLALAKRYLGKASCARMEGIEERFQRLRRLAADARVDGILYSTLKFCDTFLYEEPLIRMTCEDAGLPVLFLENDYEWTGLEQMKTRLESFLAMLGEREAS